MPEAPTVMQTPSNICLGCGLTIHDKYVYKVLPDTHWHETCLKCAECACKLTENNTCFIRNGKAYCKPDYNKLFAVKCDRCAVVLNPKDYILRCKSKIYHFECFSCCICCKKLMPGDEFQLRNDTVYCKEDAILNSNTSLSTISNQQLYLSSLSNLNGPGLGSFSMTPENSIKSNTSSTSSGGSSATFSPSNHSTSSCSSSLVDSPTNSGGNNITFSSSINSSLLLNHSGFGFNSTVNSCFHLDGNNNNSAVVGSSAMPPGSNYDSYQDKDDDRSISDGDEDDDEEEDLSDLDRSMSDEEESSLNESATSVSGPPKNQNKNRKNNQKFNGLLQHHNHQNQRPHHQNHHHRSAKQPRVRTVLNEKQLHTLKTYYNANPRPDAMLKEQLVEMTGLNPRVIRVWFQNKRCKDKKKNVLQRSDPLPLPNHPHFNIMPPMGGPGGDNSSNIRLPVTSNGLLYDNCY